MAGPFRPSAPGDASPRPPAPPLANVLLVGDPSRELDEITAALGGPGSRWGVSVAVGEIAARAALTRSNADFVLCGLADTGAGLRVLAAARSARPAAARVLFVSAADDFGGVVAERVAHQVIAGGWDPATAEMVLDRAAGGAGLIADERLRAIVGATTRLPSLPTSVLQLLRLLDDPETPMSSVVRVLQREPAMSAKALQLVNSAFFGLPRRISSIDQAAVQLGLNAIRSVVLTAEAFAAVVGVPEPVVSGVRGRAILGAQLAREIGGARADDALSAAMLRDVGELLLAARLPHRVADVHEQVRLTGCSTVAAERTVLGATHAQVGASLLALWGLPAAVVEAVAFSHTPYPDPARGLDTTLVVFVAGQLADEALHTPGLVPLDPNWIEAHGLSGRIGAWRRHAETLAMTWPAA